MTSRVAVSAALTIALLVAGGVAVATAPDEDGLSAPIPVTGGVGDRISARTIVTEVTGVRAGRTVLYPDTSDSRAVRSGGVWLVVDLLARGQTARVGLADAELRIGRQRFAGYDGVPTPAMADEPLRAGVFTRGSLVFEVPASALRSSSAELWLQTGGDMHLDDVPVVRLDLRRVRIADTIEVSQPELASS